MKSRNLTILFLITFLAVVASFMLAHKQTSQEDMSLNSGVEFADELQKNSEKINSIIVKIKDKTLNIKYDGSKWLLHGQDFAYPLDSRKVLDIVTNTANLKILEKKTSSPDRFERIGVQDPAKNTDSVSYSFITADGKEIFSMIVGKPRFEGKNNGTEFYARRNGNNQSWLVSGTYNVEKYFESWINNTIFNLKKDRIQKISVNFNSGETDYNIFKTLPGEKFYSISYSGPKPLKSQYILDTVAESLSKIKLIDVRPEKELEFEKNHVVNTRFDTFDGITVSVDSYKEGGDLWIRMSASSDNPSDEADKINSLAKGWAFKVIGNETEYMYMKLEGLLAEEEEKK